MCILGLISTFQSVSTNDLIKDFLEKEQEKINKSIGAGDIKLITTRELATAVKPIIELSEKNLAASYPLTPLILFFLAINGAALFFVLDRLVNSSISLAVIIGLIFLFVLLFLIPVYLLIRSKRSFFSLKVSSHGIGTSNIIIGWEQIAETMIMSIPFGKNYKNFLVLITFDHLILKLDMQGLSISEAQLANLIESLKLGARSL